jgi:hypothetical protein
MPRTRRLASWALVTAIVLSIGTQCLVGQEVTPAQMACCANTDHDCQSSTAVQADCCQGERVEQGQLVAYAQQVVAPLVIVTSATAALARPPDARAAFHVDTTPLRTAPPPKYVLLATFLI